MENFDESLNQFAVDLYNIGGIKFGNYKTKIGINSPIYCDLRVVVSHPKIMDNLADLLCAYSKRMDYELLCGVPYTALPIATLMSVKQNIPMLIRRKEKKDYGTKKLIEGNYKTGEKCLIVEDVVTSGSSILETVADLTSEGLDVKEAIVILNREQGGAQNLNDHGVQMHSLFTMTSLLKALLKAGCIQQATVTAVDEYIKNSQISSTGEIKNGSKKSKNRIEMTFEDRLQHAQNSIAKKLFEIMIAKQTTLCIALDTTNTDSLLHLVDTLGPYVCIIKTHIDILKTIPPELYSKLTSAAEKHNFIILEDRKFADIGNTVKLQYTQGVFNISSWADCVTVHALPGAGIIDAFKSVEGSEKKGLFLLAEMSSAGNLITKSYSEEAMRLAEKNQEIITGIVCQSSEWVTNPGFLQLTPGVKLDSNSDELGQQYNSPQKVVLEKGADIAVVGRGIIEAEDPVKVAQGYQKALWDAYKKRTSQ